MSVKRTRIMISGTDEDIEKVKELLTKRYKVDRVKALKNLREETGEVFDTLDFNFDGVSDDDIARMCDQLATAVRRMRDVLKQRVDVTIDDVDTTSQ